MSFPTDRGYAVITAHSDGTRTVEIAAIVDHGEPRSVFARHRGVTAIQIDPGVVLAGPAERRFTSHVVQVYPANGAIYIGPVTALAN